MSRTIDITPTWEAAARIYLMVLENRHAPEASRDAARAEIMRLAKAFDATQAEPEAARDELDLY